MSDDLGLGTAHFEQALEDIGYVTDEFYQDATDGIPGADKVSADRVRELVANALLGHAAKAGAHVYGSNAIQLIEHSWSFQLNTQDYIKARVIKPLINMLWGAIDQSKAKREDGTTVDDLRRKNGLSKVEHTIFELRDSLGENDPTFQAVANGFAKEVVFCSIDAIKGHEAISTAIVLAEWSADLPSYGQTREWLLEQRRRTLTWDPDYYSTNQLSDDDDLSDIEAALSAEEDKSVSKPIRMSIGEAKEHALMKEFGIDATKLSESEFQEQYEKFKILINVGRERGYLSLLEIMDLLPIDLLEIETLDLIEEMLKEMGIEVSSKPEETKKQEQVKEQEQPKENEAPPRRVPVGTTTCPSCRTQFSPAEVVVYISVGVRCPKCNQSIVV
jgi:hypothetical protein